VTGRLLPSVGYTLQLIRKAVPITITSIFRPTGTHQFGAADAAPRFSPGTGLHHLGIDGCQLSGLYDIVRRVGLAVPKGTQVYLEKDHFHVHSLEHLPLHLREQLPEGRAFIELTTKCLANMGCQGKGERRTFLRIVN